MASDDLLQLAASAMDLDPFTGKGPGPEVAILRPWGFILLRKRVQDDLTRLTGRPFVRMPWVTRHQGAQMTATIGFSDEFQVTQRTHGETIDHYANTIAEIISRIEDDLRQLRDGLQVIDL